MTDISTLHAIEDDYASGRPFRRWEARMVRVAADTYYRTLIAGKAPVPTTKKRELLTIVGPPGSGKSTFKNQHIDENVHTITIDNDAIRAAAAFFNNSTQFLMAMGLPYSRADRYAYLKWQKAIPYIANHVTHRALKDGYNVVRIGSISSPYLGALCAWAHEEGIPVRSLILLAPENLCRQSILRRIAAGGHSTGITSASKAFNHLFSKIQHVLTVSDTACLYWRDAMDQSPIPAASVTKGGGLVVHDSSACRDIENAMEGRLHDVTHWCRCRRPRHPWADKKIVKTFSKPLTPNPP